MSGNREPPPPPDDWGIYEEARPLAAGRLKVGLFGRARLEILWERRDGSRFWKAAERGTTMMVHATGVEPAKSGIESAVPFPPGDARRLDCSWIGSCKCGRR